ncbi:MAG: DUF3368 domain-containing protein [Lentisphaeria bacterium]|nr:DUF3368 domain-containing protein [Lentisphaeria bacterium]
MPDCKVLVCNTGPIIALVAGTGSLEILRDLYEQVIVPYEVGRELLAKEGNLLGASQFIRASWLDKRTEAVNASPFLVNSLDPGERAVVQVAVDEKIDTVCIDEAVGRRIARLHGLKVTGSLGVLIRAKQLGHNLSIADTVARMQHMGIRLGTSVINAALKLAGEAN